LVEMVPEDGEPHVATRVDAKLAQMGGRGQQLALLAVVQVGNDVQSLHFDTPFQAKIRSGDLHARPRATGVGDSVPNGAPLDPGRRAKSFLQKITQAKN